MRLGSVEACTLHTQDWPAACAPWALSFSWEWDYVGLCEEETGGCGRRSGSGVGSEREEVQAGFRCGTSEELEWEEWG